MKIIFLDVDGVLNCQGDFKGKSLHVLNKDMIARLDKIKEATGAKVVLISTWRKFRKHRDYLKKNGVKFIDRTIDFCLPPSERYGQRGAEIEHWLNKRPDIKKYVIIDDEWDFLEYQRPLLVKTQWLVGMQDEHVEQAINILKKGM